MEPDNTMGVWETLSREAIRSDSASNFEFSDVDKAAG